MSSGNIFAYLFASLLTPSKQGTRLINWSPFLFPRSIALEQAEAQSGPTEQALL